MRQLLPFAFLAAFFMLLGCKKKQEPTVKEDFSCVKLFDEQGQDMGLIGCTETNDWTNIALDDSEAGFFISPGTADLHGTTPVLITGIAIYPNPIILDGTFRFHLFSQSQAQNVLLQMAIIDESKEIRFQFNLQVDCNGEVVLQVPAGLFELGEYYRVYYRVSALGAPILYEGYGNVLVCDLPGSGTDCY